MPGFLDNLNRFSDGSVGGDPVQVDEMVGADAERHQHGTGKGDFRPVKVAPDAVVEQKQVAHSSLSEFGYKGPVPLIGFGPFELFFTERLQGLATGLPGQEDPPGGPSGPLRRPLLPLLLFHR